MKSSESWQAFMKYEEAIALGKSRSDCAPEYLDELIKLVQSVVHVPGAILEGGSYKCGATICMAAAAPDKDVYGFDLFGGLPYENQENFLNFADADFEEIKKVVAPFKNIKLVKGLFEDTVPKFPETLVSFIFLDSDFYESHKVFLEHFWPMLSPDGLVIFHDWTFPEVQRAIKDTISNADIARRWGIEGTNMGALRKF